VLALHTHDEGLIHSNKQVKTLADFKGQKMRGPTFLTTKMLEAFGAVPVGMPVTQVAESLTKGVVDGAIVPWEIVPSTKIHELVKFHTELDAASPALYTATFVFSMNKAKYDALPADARRCLDANSGAALSQWIGKVWDESAAGAKKLAQSRGNTIYTVPAAEVAQWRKAAEPITELWLKEAQAKGLDGAALLKSAQELLKKHDSK
jgi:TRAP-type transport system periplasmic protein